MHRAAIFLLASALLPSAHADPAYSISTPDTVLTGMVSGTAVTIRVPGTILLGASRNLSRTASVQTSFEFFSAAE